MQRLLTSGAVSFGLIMLLFTGCSEQAMVAPESEAAINTFPVGDSDGAVGAGKFFTGRDSFGVALKIRVSGQLNAADDEGCEGQALLATGTGNATHMGNVEAEHAHCFDPATLEFGDGAFTITGTNGSEISGRYEGTLVPTDRDDEFEIRGRIWVQDGEIRALDRPAEGRGTIEGMLHADGTFSYKVDGWLLHHVVEREG